MRVLITGAQGFAGRYLVARWLAELPDIAVFGLGRSAASTATFTHAVSLGDRRVDAPLPEPLARAARDPRYEYIRADLSDRPALTAALRRARPGIIVHLASGLRDDPSSQLLTTNVLGTEALYHAVHESGIPAPRIVVGSSGSVYGIVASGSLPITETHPTAPFDMYSISKGAQENAARMLAERLGIPTVIARIFAIVGPGQDERHVCGRLAAQLAAIEAGAHEAELWLGPLTATRDFIDVRDVAEALVRIAVGGAAHDTYNVASGRETPIQAIHDELMALARLPAPPALRLLPARPLDMPRTVARVDRLASLHPHPPIALRQSLADLLDYYRTLHATRRGAARHDRRPGILGGHPRAAAPLAICRPTFPPLADFAAPLQAALSAGRVTNHGPCVAAFEAELTDYLATPTVVFSSGQAALMAMLAAAGVAGGEVVVPSYTFAATPHAVCWAGARPVFAEIDPATMTLDVADAARRITPRTRAIVGVCAYGIPCDYDALRALGQRHGLRILYDSAPAFGSHRDGRPIGGFGDGQVFSFHATKAFSTMEGGAFATHDAALLDRARAIRNFGQQDGADCAVAGLNGKMTEVAAMIGLRQLGRFGAARARRRDVTAAYRARLAHVPGLRMATPRPGDDPVWLYFPLVVDPDAFGLDRDALCLALAEDNIHVRKYFEVPCHRMTRYRTVDAPSLPVTEAFARAVVALPVYSDQTDAEIESIADAIIGIQANAGAVRDRVARREIAAD